MLAIGRALMGNPRVLLMDEPSEGLAPQIVAEVGRTIAQLKAEGLSIVLVEQNIKLTLDLADDVVIVNTGAVVFSGTADEIRTEREAHRAASGGVLTAILILRSAAKARRLEGWPQAPKLAAILRDASLRARSSG